MSKKITINVPVCGKRGQVLKKPRQVEGVIALIKVGDAPHKFMIHDGSLSDFRTGYRVGKLGPIKVQRMAQISTYTRTTDRQAAKLLVEKIVAQYGLHAVRERLAMHETINA